MRYDQVWSNLVKRALRQSEIDLDAFIDQARASGMSADSVQARLLDDLENDGPIFGKFFRSIASAARMSTSSAYNQGANIGSYKTNLKAYRAAVRDDPDIQALLNEDDLDAIIESGDPEEMKRIQDAISGRDERMWVAQMQKTCHRCLPLHGTVMTMEQWEQSGFDPDSIHDGWHSECRCSLVPVTTENKVDRTQHMAPLVRNKLKSETGMKGSKKTARGVLQADLDKALEARNNAMQSLEGRRTLRLLGQTQKDGPSGTTEE